MIQNWKFQRGDIFFTRFDNAIGSEQSGNRPAVVLQNDVGNFYSPTLIVATLTSKAAKKYTQPTHCLLVNEFLSVPSIVQAEQIFTVDKSRVLKFLGHLTPEEMSRVDDAVRTSLALNPMGSIQRLPPIIRSTAAYAPPEVVDGKPPLYPYTPIKSSFEDAGSVEDMMLYTELEAAVHAMIQRLEYSFTFNPSLLTIPKRKQQVAEISERSRNVHLEDQGGNAMRLKDNTNPFIHVNPPYQLMVIHSSKLVYPRELYQRGVERKRVELIAAHFNEYVANEPKVSFRNGQFIVTDGQHTIEGRILRNGGKDLPILCKVYTGMTVEQEALLFAEQNGFSAPLTAGIKLRAKVVGGDAISKAFLAATNRVGLSLNYDSQQLTDYRIGCVGTAFRLYKQMGEPLYCETMQLIVAAWEGKPDSFRASVLKGMMHFVELYHGEFNEERLLRALRNIHPVDIYRIGQDDPAKLRGWKKYVFPIYTAYNGKCRKDALPMKF